MTRSGKTLVFPPSDYEQNPTSYVSRYGANYFYEDTADTFAVFLLGEKPQGHTVAEQKHRSTN